MTIMYLIQSQPALKRWLRWLCGLWALGKAAILLILLWTQFFYRSEDYSNVRYVLTVAQQSQKCALLLQDLNISVQNSIKVNCSKLFAGDELETCRAQRISSQQTDELTSDFMCGDYAKDFPKQSNSVEERDFPLAYIILFHKNLAQVERLLRIIYWPQNTYCLHVDASAVQLIPRLLKIASCFPNIFVSDHLERIIWGGFGTMNVTLNCMRQLVQRAPTWKYVINLSGQDFPLKTNQEIVRFLRTQKGKNNVELVDEKLPARYRYHHEPKLNRHGLPTEIVETAITKAPPPDGLKIYKGNLAVVLSREATEWILINQVAQRLATWLVDARSPDEMYWSSLVGNTWLNFPGGRNEEYLARYAVWKPSEICRGKFIRDVCIFGVEDLPRLVKLPHLFVNKLNIGYQSWTLDCLEKWVTTKHVSV